MVANLPYDLSEDKVMDTVSYFNIKMLIVLKIA